MTTDANADIQSQTELSAELEDAIRAVVEERLKSLNTSCPGVVRSFDRDKQTCSVQPVHETLWLEQDGTLKQIPLPICTDVPVQFSGGGDCVLTFDVSAGDECILLFSQRCIDEWWQNGGTHVPGERRMHDLSDGMAVVGLSSQARALSPGVASGGAELRTRDGSVLMRVDQAAAYLGGVSGAQPTYNGTAMNAALQAFLTVAATGTAVVTPANAVAFCVALGGAAGTLSSALAATLTTIAKVL